MKQTIFAAAAVLIAVAYASDAKAAIMTENPTVTEVLNNGDREYTVHTPTNSAIGIIHGVLIQSENTAIR